MRQRKLLPYALLAGLFAATIASANAARFAVAGSSQGKYLVNGKPTDARQALAAALEGQTVLQCKEMVPTISASGTSIGLKAKKQ